MEHLVCHELDEARSLRYAIIQMLASRPRTRDRDRYMHACLRREKRP